MCTYVDSAGDICNHKIKNGTRCQVHKGRITHIECVYKNVNSGCQNFTRSKWGVCSNCQHKSWWKDRLTSNMERKQRKIVDPSRLI